MMKTLLLIAAAVTAYPTIAQSAAQTLGGTAVPGVCLLSREAVYANTKVGIAATARMRELTQQAEAEVVTDRKPLEDEATLLQTQRSKLKPADFEQRQQALGERAQIVQAKAQQRTQELELTRQKALAQIGDQAQPVIAAVYKAKGCGLIVDRNSVLGGNMTNDLTPAVVQGLDAKVTSISFNRAVLTAQTAAR
jgi:Skp family chaperone for outer membrane proteins